METANTVTPLTKKSDSYKIIIPEKVERLIRFLCEKIWNTEWSGVLFYTPTGKFEDGSLEIHCVDVFPMDIGTTTYTEFDMSPDVISYMTHNPELLDCKMGLIHSHNNMATFFSGTDTDTLKVEGSERNHFVSLIVNNEGSYTAAITRKVKYTTTKEFSYESFDGVVKPSEKELTEGEEIEYFNLDVVFERDPKTEFKEVADRLDEIKEAKTSKTPSTPSTPAFRWNEPYSSPYEFDWKNFSENKSDFPKSNSITKSFKDIISLENAVNDKVISEIVNQLITGSVTVTKLDEDSKKKLLNNMTQRFDKRFGSGEDNNYFLFKNWAIDFIEYLIWYSVDEPSLDESEIAEEICKKTIEALKKLPTNYYINEYINLFTSYVDRV